MAGTQRRHQQLILGLLLAFAGTLPPPATAALPTGAAVAPLVQPTWAELSEAQKTILAPLEKEWDQLELQRRIKWIGIADRYPSMLEAEQERIKKQMLSWALLTPEERKIAREKYKNLKQATPEKKEDIKQKWTEYLELSEEKKQLLKEKAVEKKPLAKAPVKPLSQAPVLKLAPGASKSNLSPDEWPNVIVGPTPGRGKPLFPLPITLKASRLSPLTTTPVNQGK